MGRLKIFNNKKLAKKDKKIIEEDLDDSNNFDEDNSDESDYDEVIAILTGDDAKYELKHRAELYYDSVSRTIPEENQVLEEYKSNIN